MSFDTVVPSKITPNDLSDISKMERNAWCAAIDDTAEETGYFEQIGQHHAAAFIDNSEEAGETLLVSFDTYDRAAQMSPNGYPLCFNLALENGWSHLSIVAHDNVPPAQWFRSDALYAYFDRLVEDDFFEDYERVVFYGAGPCGYAAATYSVAAPGATVLTIAPQATLDSRLSSWDNRYPETRREDFSSRYGFAPNMVDAAEAVFVLYDPKNRLDAMHASMFNAPHVTRFPLRNSGRDTEAALVSLDMLTPLISAAVEARLDAREIAQIFRGRRQSMKYLRSILSVVEAKGDKALTRRLCRYALGIRPRAKAFLQAMERVDDVVTLPEA